MTKSDYPQGLLLFTLAVVAMVGCLIWAPASRAAAIHLRADQHMHSWQSTETFGADALLEDAVIVEGHSLPTVMVAGCRVTWAARGIAVLAKTCGEGPIRLHYVAFGRAKNFKFTFNVRGE